jgi:hypothetical protein
MTSPNGQYALVLTLGLICVVRRNPTSGTLGQTPSDIIWMTISISSNTTPNNNDIVDMRFVFNVKQGAIHVDYQDSTRNNSWIRLFSQTNSGISHDNFSSYRSMYILELDNNGALNIKNPSGTVWSSTGDVTLTKSGTTYIGKSFNVLDFMGHTAATTFTLFTASMDFSQNILTIMTQAKTTLNCLGFTVRKTSTGTWEYAIITTAGTIYPVSYSTPTHTFLKIIPGSAGNPYRTSYIEMGTVQDFTFLNGRDLYATVISRTVETETKLCANKSKANPLSRGFVYNPNTGDCSVVGESTGDLNAALIPEGGNVGFISGWKKT